MAGVTDWQISVGDWSEAMLPVVFVLAALASAWVLFDARRRAGFSAYAVAAWALLTLILPPVVLPLYLAARLFTPHEDTSDAGEAAQDNTPQTEVQGGARQPEAEDGDAHADVTAEPQRARMIFTLPTLYLVTLLALGTIYFYSDYRSADARLARAEQAKLYSRPEKAIREYRAALRRREDAHTRKLLGLELLKAGRAEEALAEFRAAGEGGEPDERIHFHTAAALATLSRPEEAAAAYLRFLRSDTCSRPASHALCDVARERLRALGPPLTAQETDTNRE